VSFYNNAAPRARRGASLRLVAALCLGTAASALMAEPASAQVNTASLRGTITMAEGGTASQVIAVDLDSGYRRTSVVGADGSYNLPSLRPGRYRLEIVTPSGTRRTDTITLLVGQNSVFDIDLSASAAAPSETTDPGSVTTEGDDIIVTGSRVRSTEGGEVGVTITQRLIEQLPQNNRNFLAFADLAPGVQFITDGQDNSRLQGGAQGSNSVNVFIDGVGQKDYVLKNGVTGQDSTSGNPFPQLAIGEYKVISSNYKAEFDQVSSVAITAITKSGTNEFHGEGFVDFTNQNLRDARPTELRSTTGKVRSRDLQFGGALGGPIIKDIAHFFVTYEGKRRIDPRDVTPGLDLPVSFFPQQYQGLFGPQNQEFNENLYFGKIDIAPTSKDLLEFSVKYRQESGEQFGSGIAAFDTRSLTEVSEWRGLARWEHTEDTWINDFKVAYEDATWNPRPFQDGNVTVFNARVPQIPPLIGTRDGDILRFGAGSNFQDKGQKGWTISDDFTYTGLDNHTIKLGVKAKWVTLNTTEQNNLNPVYTYDVGYNPGGGTFNDTIPFRLNFAAPVGDADPNISSKNFQFGVYIQDDWDVTDRLTLNLGIRWDYERTPAFLDYQHDPAQVAAVSPANYPNLNNADYDINDFISTGNEREPFMGAFQPRVGFSYKLDEDGRFSVFGGYGRSYDRTQFDFIQQELAQGVFAGREFRFNNPGAIRETCDPSPTCVTWDPIYLTQAGRDQLLASLPTGGGRELRFINNDIKTPYSDQFSLGLRGRFGILDTEVGYSHVDSHDGFAYILGNRRPDGSFFPPTGAPDSPFGFPPSPFGAIILGTNGIETRADTAYLKLTKRYSEASPWSIDATYTYTQAEENRKFGEVFSLDFPSIEDYPFIRSNGVRKHRLVMAGTVDTPIGVTFSSKFQIASPAYFSDIVGVAGTPPVRGVVSTESEGNGDRWGFRQMDLSITKVVPLGFVTDDTLLRFRVDIINLFNDRNYNSFSALTGLRNENTFTTDGPPRTIKFSAGFAF
jgi:outer membrane receptor protein involved in Fe transport